MVSSEEIDNRQCNRDSHTDTSTDSSIAFRFLRVTFAQTRPINATAATCIPSPNEKRQTEDIHAYLMCRHGFRTHFRSHHSGRHKTDTHQYLLNKTRNSRL